MDASRHLQRARELLDRNRPELAESALSDAIDSAVQAEDLVMLTRARMALGELLFEQGRDLEALPFLQAVIRTEIPDGSVDNEVKTAARLLRRIRGMPE
jgi:predicted negative regulator of RcsB-dependent stress response